MIEVLSSKRVESFRAEREDEVASLIAYARRLSASSPPTTINLSKKILTLMNNILCRIMFGEKYKELVNSTKGGACFMKFLMKL